MVLVDFELHFKVIWLIHLLEKFPIPNKYFLKTFLLELIRFFRVDIYKLLLGRVNEKKCLRYPQHSVYIIYLNLLAFINGVHTLNSFCHSPYSVTQPSVFTRIRSGLSQYHIVGEDILRYTRFLNNFQPTHLILTLSL